MSWSDCCGNRLKSNGVLERHIQHLLMRPVGRPPKKPVVRYHQFMYQAGTWDRERRVVAKVVRHAKYVTFQMAEVAVPCRLYRSILERIRRLASLSPRAAPI